VRRPARSFRIALLLPVCLAALGADIDYPTYEKPESDPPIDYPVAGAKIFDAVVLRPLGALAVPVGAAAFVVAAPLGVFGIGIRETWSTFVLEPVDFAFRRPLGDF
jgi:hypothetical protein